MTPEQRQSTITTTETMERHNLMYTIAKSNPDKGVAGGDCNVTQCQREGASSYNEPMSAFYCQQCADTINSGNDEPFVDSQPDFSIEYGKDPENSYVDSPIIEPVNNKVEDINEYSRSVPENAHLLGYDKGATLTRKHEKVGRNNPCPCGSGKKYKKCCN